MFYSGSFMVSGLTFKSLIHFELIFVHVVDSGVVSLFFHVTIQFSQHNLLRGLSFSIVYSWLLCHKLIDHICMGLFLNSQFSSITRCLSLCQ